MLDQMVESKDTLKESKTLFFLFSFFIVLAIASVIGVGIWHLSSLFGYFREGGMQGDLDLSSLVAPVVDITEDEPPQPEEKVEKVTKVEQNVDVRKTLMLDVSQSTKEPDTTSVEKNTQKTTKDPLNTKVCLTCEESDAKTERRPGEEMVTQSKGIENGNTGSTLSDDGNEPQMQTPTPKATPTPKPEKKTISGGVVNGKARNLVTPQYPAAARTARASGQVQVQVTIDESGNVVSASAISGHPLLRQAAVNAARSSKFNPTTLSGQPVSVTGIIIYNFVP